MKELSSVLNQYLDDHNLNQKIDQYRIFKEWPSIVGERISTYAIPEKVYGKTLYIKVENPSWKTELSFMRNDLLKKINQKSNNKFNDIKII